MKNLLAFFSAMLVLAGMCGCSSEDGNVETPPLPPADGIELSESSLSFDADGGKEIVTVTAAAEWTATSSAEDWCTVKTSGSRLNITVAKNYQTAERTATITVTSDEQEATISVAQAAGDGEYNAFTVKSTAYPDLAPTGSGEIELLNHDVQTVTLRVEIEDDNCVWSMKVIEGADFIVTNEIVNADTQKSFNLSIAENIATEAREGKIKIWSEYKGLECSYILTIKQPAGLGKEQYVPFTVMSEEYPYITETESKDEAGNIIFTRDKAFFATCTPCEIPIKVMPTKRHYKWTAEVVEGADFITIPELVDYSGAKTFPVQFAYNTTSAERVGRVKISSLYQGFEYAYEFTFKQQKYMQHTPKDDEIKVMSYNVYVYAHGPNGWANRKDTCIECIRYHKPDVIGLQEVSATAWKDITNALLLDGYQYSGVEQFGLSEFLYNTKVLRLINSGTFWHSDTPFVPLTGPAWGAMYARGATWGIFEHMATGKKICYITTHLDHLSASHESRVKSMELIMRMFEEDLGKDCDYWISTGDYNTADTNSAFNAIKGKMKQARSAAPADRTDRSRTYNNFRISGGGIIDHILCSESMEVVEFHTIIENFRYMPYASDHYPVYSIIKL